jgi:hypothetical protein
MKALTQRPHTLSLSLSCHTTLAAAYPSFWQEREREREEREREREERREHVLTPANYEMMQCHQIASSDTIS